MAWPAAGRQLVRQDSHARRLPGRARIILREPGFEILVRKLTQAEALAVGAPPSAETGIVLTARQGRDARGLLQGLRQSGLRAEAST